MTYAIRRLASMAAALLLAATVLPPTMAQASAGDAQAGAQSFLVCSACHGNQPGSAALIGPNLWSIVGRPVAAAEGFDYSPELKAHGGEWTAERLDAFLANPMEVVPGTRMGFVGVTEPTERANLIAYLATLVDGASVAATAAVDYGPDWPAGPGQAETGALCNACHSLAIVKQQQLSRTTWDKLLDWMVEEQGMPDQTPEARELILGYLAEHFGAPE